MSYIKCITQFLDQCWNYHKSVTDP